MLDIFSENKALVWLVFVFLTTSLLLFLNKRIFTWLEHRAEERESINASMFKMLRQVLAVFFWVFGMGLAAYAVFQKEVYAVITQNLQRAIYMALVIMLTIIGAAFVQAYFQRRMDEGSKKDKQDPTSYRFLNYFCTFFIYLIGICLAAMAIPELRNMAQGALAGAGVMALILGVASQEAIANVVGGLFVVFFKPFRIGDTIFIGTEIKGVVEDINLRHTVLTDFHNHRIIIPNATINKENIVNFNLGDKRSCEWVQIGISYDSDVKKAINIMREEAENHPDFLDVRSAADKRNEAPAVKVKVTKLEDSAVSIRAWVWSKDFTIGWNMKHDLLQSIKARFDKAGIEIPFPHRTIVYKKTV